MAGPRAHRLRTLQGPAGMTASSVTLSGGEHPTVCAVWSGEKQGALECYAAGADSGTVVPGESAPRYANVALSYAGTSLAWTAEGPAGVPDLVYARLKGSNAGRSTRLPALAPGDEPDEAALVVSDLAWEGDGTLLVSHAYDADVNGAVARVSITTPPNGWSNARTIEGENDGWYVLYGVRSATDAGKALALQMGFIGREGAQLTRAVEMNVASGRVDSVVSVPAKDRRISSVSGGVRGVLYRTEGSDGQVWTYWRAPGQAHGVPLAGIPSDSTDLVAQP